MNAFFADTNYYVAVVSPRDQLHVRADAFALGYLGRIVTSEFVFLEVASFLTEGPNRSVFEGLLAEVRNDPDTTVLPVTTTWFQRGIDLFSKRRDKEWSLTDCVSFEMMRDLGLTHALTADRHFTQAGFTIEFP